MLLQQLVDDFNDKFSQEHGFDFRPLILQNGTVSGLFEKSRLNSVLTSVRLASNLQIVTGYAAQLVTNAHFFHRQEVLEIENLLSSEPGLQRITLNSIINFDRLSRTVHLLNFLNIRQRDQVLFLEVDPRHIMGVKDHHGAYFEEIIHECGLTTADVVISLATSGIQGVHHHFLLQGLNNYREHGYKIALDVGHLISADSVLNLCYALAPDYVRVSAPNENYLDLKSNTSLVTRLVHLKELTHSFGGKVVMQEVKNPEQALTAIQIGFDWVEAEIMEKTFQLKKKQLETAAALA